MAFHGMANVFTVGPGGVELPYLPLPQIHYLAQRYDFAKMGPADAFMMFSPVPDLPFPLPLGQVVAGNVGGIDGVKWEGCPG